MFFFAFIFFLLEMEPEKAQQVLAQLFEPEKRSYRINLPGAKFWQNE